MKGAQYCDYFSSIRIMYDFKILIYYLCSFPHTPLPPINTIPPTPLLLFQPPPKPSLVGRVGPYLNQASSGSQPLHLIANTRNTFVCELRIIPCDFKLNNECESCNSPFHKWLVMDSHLLEYFCIQRLNNESKMQVICIY